MKYRVFNSEQEAIDAEMVISQSMGFPKISINAKTGLLDSTAQQTERWAIPQQIADGRWVFPSPDDTGIDAENSWFPTVFDL